MKKSMDVALESEKEAGKVLNWITTEVEKLNKQLDKATIMQRIAQSTQIQALVHRKVQKAMQTQYQEEGEDEDDCLDFKPDEQTRKKKDKYERLRAVKIMQKLLVKEIKEEKKEPK